MLLETHVMSTDMNNQKDAWKSIVHEMRTQLITIELGVSGIQDFLPILISAYRTAVEATLVPNDLHDEQLVLLSEVLANNKTASLKAKSNLEMLSNQLKALLED